MNWIAIAWTLGLAVQGGGGPRPEDGPPGRSSEPVLPASPVGARVDRLLSGLEGIGFSGAIVVEHEGEVVLERGYGLSDRGARRPYTAATVQSHGSLTKQMTAAAILLLESRGELSVEDTLEEHFEDVPEDKRGITLHQLLTHSSGVIVGIGPDEEPVERGVYVERAMAEPLRFEPGTGFGYSNLGYALLGVVIERVSGRGYESFLRDELFLPAGLDETGYLLPEWDEERLAEGYTKGRRWGRVVGRGWLEDGPSWHLRANGGLHTTVGDMHRWLDTVRGRGVLDAETAARWTTAHVDEGYGDSGYAYGWVVREGERGPMVSHAGSNSIFSADFVWLPEAELFFYVQGNSASVPALGQRDRILAAAFDEGFDPPPLVRPDPEARPEDAEARAGTYRLEGGSLELTTDHTRLVAKVVGQAALDRLLDHDEAQRRRFAELDRRVARAMERLFAGREDALAGLVGEGDDPVAATRVLLDRIARFGELEALRLVGSFENAPGSPLAELGPWTTFVHADFDGWNQYWNLVWSEEGTYVGTASGPWPSFVLVPVGEGRYRAVLGSAPWKTRDLRFEADCLVVEDLRACRDA